MASRDALPFLTDGHVVVDRPVPAPLGDPENTAPGHGSSDRHVVVDGRESSSAAAYLQTASILSQNHRTQVLPSPSSHPSRARDSLSSDDRRVDSNAAIHSINGDIGGNTQRTSEKGHNQLEVDWGLLSRPPQVGYCA